MITTNPSAGHARANTRQAAGAIRQDGPRPAVSAAHAAPKLVLHGSLTFKKPPASGGVRSMNTNTISSFIPAADFSFSEDNNVSITVERDGAWADIPVATPAGARVYEAHFQHKLRLVDGRQVRGGWVLYYPGSTATIYPDLHSAVACARAAARSDRREPSERMLATIADAFGI